MTHFRPKRTARSPAQTRILGCGKTAGAVAVLAFLTACGAPSPTPAPMPLRDPDAPVASQVDAGLTRLEGDWIVVEGNGLRSGARVSVGSGVMSIDGAPFPVTDAGMGRLRVAGQPLWVHWIDADNRTAALGDPTGQRVWIMDRSGQPGERLHAAREILDWYGYNPGRWVR